jgi:hypothetical protein
MPLTSLRNISVPIDDGQRNGTLLMPKLQYRFRVVLQNFGIDGGLLTEVTKQVVDVTRPTVNFETITLDVYNSRSYLAGKHSWDPITLTLRDDVNNNISKVTGQQLQKQFDFYEQASAVSGASYKFETKIQILDGGNGGDATAPTVLEQWNLVGCYLESANYNSLAYSASTDPVTVTLSIRYDNAVQTDADGTTRNNGVGEPVNRPSGDTSTGPGVLVTGNQSVQG